MRGIHSGGIVSVGQPKQGAFDVDEVLALRELREAVGMDCENVPLDVREALHRVPNIKKVHHCALLEVRDERD